MITILAVGKRHESWASSGISRYQERCKPPFDVKWVLLPHSSLETDRARQEESERILSRLKADDFVLLLDERGKNITSPELSALLETQFQQSRSVVCVIGGAYGVSDELRGRADFVWSLSGLVFPHQLVRLILAEQVYRAQAIAQGQPYHHE